MATHGSPARRRRRRTGSRDPPGEKSGGLLEDLDLLLEPLVLALEPLQLGLLGLALGQRLRRARRQVLVPPAAQLPGAQAQLGRDLAQPLAAVQQPLDRLGLELGREPPPGSLLHHPALLRCSGSLASPPLLRGRSICDGTLACAGRPLAVKVGSLQRIGEVVFCYLLARSQWRSDVLPR